MPALLVLTILLPLLGAIGLWWMAEAARGMVRHVALGVALATLALAGVVVWQSATADPANPPVEASLHWLSSFGGVGGLDVRFSVGLDGLSLWMFGLAALLSVTAVLVSWEAVAESENRPAFFALLLMLESGMLGVFAARDIILFYVFFEATLIPLFFLIGIWGHDNRRYAAVKFFLFTLAGSLLTFVGLLTIVVWNYQHPAAGAQPLFTFSIAELTTGLERSPMPTNLQLAVFLALFAGFAIKVPLFPLHTWLPLAHVEAPTAGSILLAGILLKIGTYGFIRFSLPMLPEASVVCMPWILVLSTAAILYGALVALVQQDIKRLIAYSSVSHMGFCMLGIFALNGAGLAGGALQMIGHGLSTGGLFAVVGMIYERYHTREIASFGGLASKFPRLALMMVLLTFASIGLPGMCGFSGEVLLMLGMFQRAWGDAGAGDTLALRVSSVLAVFGIVIGAWYMLLVVRKVFFGEFKVPGGAHGQHGDGAHAPADGGHGHSDHGHSDHGHGHDDHAHGGHGHAAPAVSGWNGVPDLNFRELAAIFPLLVFIVWIGLAPGVFLDKMNPVLGRLSSRAMAAAAAARPMGLAETRVDTNAGEFAGRD